MAGTCETCKHWDGADIHSVEPDWGRCELISEADSHEPAAGVAYTGADASGERAPLLTFRTFGCTLYVRREG